MELEHNLQDDEFDLQFGYNAYYGCVSKLGWLLTYNVVKNAQERHFGTLYFVDELNNNFKVTIPYFPSFLIEVKHELNDIEEYIRRKYEGTIQRIECVERIDAKEFNHLNKPPKNLLKIYFTTESGFQVCLKHMKEIINETATNRHRQEVYADFCQEKKAYDIKNEIIQIHEFDIPYEIQFAVECKIRCGSWFKVSYDGKDYQITLFKDKVAYPDLRIFAFDIETCKAPLKFSNPDVDEIMMISIMSEEFGELIINRKIVSQDIQEFEYNAKDEMKGVFRVFNEASEEELLIRFLEVIMEYKPHIITTYNGGYFDWPFIDVRMQKYKLSLETSLNFKKTVEYYECGYIVHLDCYKWVKRDSYLPMGNQGLKEVTRIKLGYHPDEIDPEDMMRCAVEEPQKLASYSVSDAVATFYLYLKYVHPHIFSVSSLIPFPPVQILCKGAGTLCETLLIAESGQYKLLIPNKKRTDGLCYYNGHMVENLTYVGGHVESLKAGIFRSDFKQPFYVEQEIIDLIIENLDNILEEYTSLPEYSESREKYIQTLRDCQGNIECKGSIYHLDVGAMYPNIILTNRLQPYSVVDEDICIRCDYDNGKNKCKRKLKWISRAEYYPPGKNEIQMIKNQLEQESFIEWNGETSVSMKYNDLPELKQESILKERVIDYSKSIYKRTRKTEEKEQDITICQREVPFYVETVRKFRDQRYVYKELYKKAMIKCEEEPTSENKKNLVVFNSLQVAYKCILNSFYGYVMREGSRWYSLEMAATVCNIGGQIIKLAKDFLQNIGIPLELDTDGIWGMFPEKFPFNIKIGNKNISVFALTLNYFVCKTFSNDQYQILNNKNEYEIKPQNSIFFELDGPYKTMVIPSSTEENKLLKKRYVVFDFNNKLCELKGFELKRKGELNLIKKFQEDIFIHFNDGDNLLECYASLANICNYWLDIIEKKGEPLGDDGIFHMFSESRSLSKNLESYGSKKSNILGTARKLSEFLGNEILEEKLKCEFIMSRYPINAPVADRAIPVMIFKSADKSIFLKKWLKTTNFERLSDIIDWDYYRKRFESILQRLIVIPAYLQQIDNPVPRVSVPSWVKDSTKKEKLNFAKTEDIEDYVKKIKLKDVFYNSEYKKADEIVQSSGNDISNNISTVITVEQTPNLRTSAFVDYIRYKKPNWMDLYIKKIAYDTNIIKIELLPSNIVLKKYLNGNIETCPFSRHLYLDVTEPSHFANYTAFQKYICNENSTKILYSLDISEDKLESSDFNNFFSHFSIKCTYNRLDPEFELFAHNTVETEVFIPVYISSFNYMKKTCFAITTEKTYFISDIKHPSIEKQTVLSFKQEKLDNYKVIVVCKNDSNLELIKASFDGYFIICVDVTQQIFLESFESLMKLQLDLYLQMKLKFNQLFDLSRYSKIPILNIDENVLDYMLYTEFISNDCIPDVNIKFNPSVVREELINPGYYNTYCLSFECCNSILLAIIEYKTISAQHSEYHGLQRKDFQVLRTFIKNLVVSALNNNSGTRNILQSVAKWIKKTSRIISQELRETVEILHQQFLVGLISKLKENQYNIIASSKELIIIDTKKTTREGAIDFAEYLKKKIATFESFELLNFRCLRFFKELGIVDFENFVAVENNEKIAVSNVHILPKFLNLYFSDEEIKNETFFSFVNEVNTPSLKMMLRLLSYKRDIHGLASNCYKLKRCSEFENESPLVFNLSIFCKKCGFENLLRNYCLKCCTNFEKELIEEECLRYLQYCWKLDIGGDLCCNKCGGNIDSRLKEYCCCGGKYTCKTHFDEISKLKIFVNTNKFNLAIEKYLQFFNK